MKFGSVESSPGTTTTGWLEITELPTGGSERLPLNITEGTDSGPTLWVTGALHGNEVTGIAAAQDFMTDEIAKQLNGTVVCIPVLNPAGVRLDQRNSYYRDEDPNRYFPYDLAERVSPPSIQELINERIFERFAATADALISLHEGWINEALYTIIERVRYGQDRTKSEAQALATTVMELADAFGLPTIREYDVGIQEAHGLQRSFECAAVNAVGVPALTPELGSPHIIEERYLDAAVTGIHNVMRALDMIPGEPEPNEAAFGSPVDYNVKRVDGPVTDVSGIVRHRVDVGDVVAPGDPIADITTLHGTVKTTVETEQEGYVLGRRQGVAVYENDTLISMAARDDGSLVTKRA